jgi:hypothetical protein
MNRSQRVRDLHAEHPAWPVKLLADTALCSISTARLALKRTAKRGRPIDTDACVMCGAKPSGQKWKGGVRG